MSPEANSTRPLPHDLDNERAVLGAILVRNELIHQVTDRLTPEDFFLDSHQRIFSEMIDLFRDGHPVDELTLKHRLESNSRGEPVSLVYLSALSEGVPRLENISHYVDVIKKKSVLRTLINSSAQIINRCHAEDEDVMEILKKAEDKLFEISQGFIKKNYMPLSEALVSAYEHLDRIYREKAFITGISTGYSSLDQVTCGLQRGDLVILAARPSMGKTSFAMNIALNAAVNDGKVVLVFSLEMSARQLAMRLISSEAMIDGQKIRSGYFSREDWERIGETVGKLAEAKLFIDETSSLTVLEMQTKARRIKKEFGLDMIVVDYMQLMYADRRYENRVQEIASISRAMKGLAKELDVPVIALSQLSRAPEARKGDHRPMLADLRESGSIEQDADLVAFIFREEVYVKDPALQGKAEIIIAKQRNGPLKTIDMVFLKENSKFVQPSYEDYPVN